MIKTKSQILLEGRYDSLTRKIVNDMMVFIKDTEGDLDESISIELPDYVDKYESPNVAVKISSELIIYRTDEDIIYGNKNVPYHVHTYIAEDDTLVVQITIDESYGRKYYEEIFYKLNEDVRHEIEHFTQYIYPDRQKPLQNTAEYETTYKHHMDPSEIEALAHGFYRRAKLEKRPFESIILDDLNKDIVLGNLSQKEADEILKAIIDYSKKRIPDAIYLT